KRNKSALKKLSERNDVEVMTIDFGLESRISSGKISAQFDYIPPELVKLAAEYGIGFEVSNYCAEDFDRALNEACSKDFTDRKTR
ncbi:MAG TPA: hypothetical protein VFH34_14875, partial [Anaerolineales bacterium]|nr:hypothetical protein [Anaerolineales bacterium]